jgi:hypothetical protein
MFSLSSLAAGLSLSGREAVVCHLADTTSGYLAGTGNMLADYLCVLGNLSTMSWDPHTLSSPVAGQIRLDDFRACDGLERWPGLKATSGSRLDVHVTT